MAILPRTNCNPPVSIPPFRAVFEDLEHCWADVVLGIEPWKLDIGMERRSPFESIIVFELHAEQRIWEASKVVIINAGIHEGRRQTELADVVFHGEFACPQG